MRLEVQGLRAIAVVGVLLFHVGWRAVPGGFLGVDVFFVISGFLITRNILVDIEEGNFTFRRFYSRRAYRLGPALLVTILASLALAWLYLPPNDTVSLAKSAIAATLGLSNIWFWSKVGYFDPGALTKPLLHTWSLGVEEQYYLAAPAVLLLSFRHLGKAWLLPITLFFAVASLLGALLLYRTMPSAVFYWMPFRVFEFAIGAAIAVPPIAGRIVSKGRSLAFLAGVCLIIASMLAFDEHMPVLLALIPCVGAALVIIAGNPPLIGRILVNPPASALGRISYSLYLVHWPIVVFYFRSIEHPPVLFDRVAMLVISIAAGLLLYAGVERPMRSQVSVIGVSIPKTRAKLWQTAAIGALATIVVTSALVTHGWRFRVDRRLPELPSTEQMWSERNISSRMDKCFLQDLPEVQFSQFNTEHCLKSANERESILIIGDSFAADLYSALSQAYPETDFLLASVGNCTPRLESTKSGACREMLNALFFEFLPHHRLRAVVLEGNWNLNDADIMLATARHISQFSPVVVASPPVRFKYTVPDIIFRSRARTISDAEAAVFIERASPTDHISMAKRFSGLDQVRFFDTQELMIARGPRLFDENGKLIFLDNAHLTRAGAQYFARRIVARYPEIAELFEGAG